MSTFDHRFKRFVSTKGLCLGLMMAAGSGQAQAEDPAPGLSLRQAVATALLRNVNLRIANDSIDAARGALVQQQGATDPVISAQTQQTRSVMPLTASGGSAVSQKTDTWVNQVSLSQPFANGMQASVSLAHTTSRDSSAQIDSGVPLQKASLLEFQLRKPLLRTPGLGQLVAAAEADLQAGLLELEFTAAQTTLDVALAYWDCHAKLAAARISLASDQRSEELLADLGKLVEADEVPKAELYLAQASLSAKRVSRLAAQQSATQARRALGRLLGIEGNAIFGLGELADPVPGDVAPARSNKVVVDSVRLAVQSRADIAALRQRALSAELRLAVAQQQTKPQLDLLLGATLRGQSEDKTAWASAFSYRAGPGYSVGLSYELPIGNRAASGASRQQAAALQAVSDRLQDLVIAIDSGVHGAAEDLQSSGDQLAETNRTVPAYAASVQNERIKRRLGLVTLVELLSVEDRYNEAQFAAVQARVAYASAIARWRFETGQLLQRSGTNISARIDMLLDATLN